VVGEGSGVAERVRREGPRRHGAGSPLQGGTGGPPPESCRWSSATAGQGHQPGGTRGFLRSAAEARLRARGGRFRAAPQPPGIGCVAFGRGLASIRQRNEVFSAPRAAAPHPIGGARGGAAKPGGDEPLSQPFHGARGRVPRASSGPATLRRTTKPPRREGPFIGFGCRRAFLAHQPAGAIRGDSGLGWPSPPAGAILHYANHGGHPPPAETRSGWMQR